MRRPMPFQRRAVAFALLLLSGLLWSGFAGSSGDPWIRHSRFEDFSKGTFGNGGENIYAARAGGIQMIHRWDFNNDGYIDLISGNDHNPIENEDILVYWGTAEGPQSLFPELWRQGPLARLTREWKARERNATRLP